LLQPHIGSYVLKTHQKKSFQGIFMNNEQARFQVLARDSDVLLAHPAIEIRLENTLFDF